MDEIHFKIATRLRAKLDRNFSAADDLQHELADVGVFLHDDKRQYRTDGVGFGGGGSGPPSVLPQREYGSNNARRNRPYTFAPSAAAGGAPPEGTEEVGQIERLVARRAEAKLNRDYGTSDSIQLQLKDEHDVYVDDKGRCWGIGNPLQETGGREPDDRGRRGAKPYGMSDLSQSLSSPEEEDAIVRKVEERAAAKRRRDFDAADSLRDDLARNHGVVVDDGSRLWSAGGRFPGRDHAPYEQSRLSERVDDSQLESLLQKAVEERAVAKMAHNYDRADALRDGLARKYGVVIDDKQREWSVGGNFDRPAGWIDPDRPYVQRGGTGGLDDEVLTVIRDKVDARQQAKRDGEFQLADSLRDELTETYNLQIDDKRREWLIGSDEYTRVVDAVVGEEDPLSPEDTAAVQGRIAERTAQKKARNYDAADAIRDELWGEYGVAIDDRNMEWRVVTEDDNDAQSQRSAFAETQQNHKEAGAGIAQDSNFDNFDDNDLNADFDAVFGSEEEDELANVEKEDEPAGNLSSSSSSVVDLASLTVPKLKAKLREVGLPVSGVKAVLIERLEQA